MNDVYSRVILVINPQSSNIQRIEVRAQELARYFSDIKIENIETTPRSAPFHTRLISNLNSGDGRILIAIGGGDGTVNMVLNAIMSANPQIDNRNVVLLPLWGGNANDFAHMLNGLSSRVKLKSVFEKGNVVSIYPFEIAIASSSAKSKTRYAVCYASFGASAYAADQLTKTIDEKGRFNKYAWNTLLNEFRRVLRAVLDAPGFDVEQDGDKVRIFEQLFSNGSRMAKVDRLPVNLTDKQFYRATRSDKPPTFYFYALRLLRGKKLGEIRQRPVSFTLKERAWAQFDGEVTVVPENTTITIGHSGRMIQALSTKLNSNI